MAKRKNLRNPDILPFDYVSVLLNWTTTSPLTATPTFKVAKVLGGTFPFNATMLSFSAVDSSSSISFTFRSPFDINTSPWQFELELAFTTTASKFRPTAVYNGSNNQVTVKFNVGNLVINTAYPVVFTAKRYRPTTQYLAQLAAAAQNPVSINALGSITATTPVAANTGLTIPLSGNFTAGYQFVAPTNFTITSVTYQAPAGIQTTSYAGYVTIVRSTSPFPVSPGTGVFNFLDEVSTGLPIFPVEATRPIGPCSINTGQTVGVFIGYAVSSNSLVDTTSQGMANNYSTNIAGTPITLSRITANVNSLVTSIISGFGASIYSEPSALYIPRVSFTYTTTGGIAWSNILY